MCVRESEREREREGVCACSCALRDGCQPSANSSRVDLNPIPHAPDDKPF